MNNPSEAMPGAPSERAAADSDPAVAHLLVRAGEGVCALPLAGVRRVVRALVVHRLPGSAPELLGLAEYGGEPLAVLDLARLVGAPAGANPSFPVTVIVAGGALESPELIGIAADAALEVVSLPRSAIGDGGRGISAGEVDLAGEVVQVIDLVALGAADGPR